MEFRVACRIADSPRPRALSRKRASGDGAGLSGLSAGPLGFSAAVVALVCSAVCYGQTREELDQARNRMVDEEIVAAGVKNPRVIQAMRITPRHEFVSLAQRKLAYYDMALPIGNAQTISPPFVVASMTEELDPQPSDKVLEIGTGSGYQAAVLSPLVREVYSIEIVEPLGRKAAAVLRKLAYENVHTKVGDGYQGWPEHAPFDKIIVTCSPEHVPPALVAQLREGGRMVIPVGERYQQNLYLMKKVDGKMEFEALRPTLFVPMTGKAEEGRRVLPDPVNPSIHNGDFEEVVGESGEAAAWHYQRQAELVSGDGAPSGDHYMRFSNFQPGRGSQALQGMAVDGREVRNLRVSLYARGEELRQGQDAHQQPMLVITFYDDRRATAGQGSVGPWLGTFDWRQQSAVIPVPPRAREAIVRIGLQGATGKLSLDQIEIGAQKEP
ncbi:MAG: protein-L-isoaspartate(D-aspartate) O-methyltransferase [Pirellulales bacterium]|nr:protein-L-isoaspartate(D-aspartate) O-methyltransferase [Pirellulales bacterium]